MTEGRATRELHGLRRRVAAGMVAACSGAALLFFLASPPAEAGACDAPTISFRWGGQSNGDGTPDLRWTNAGNWDLGRVPTLSDSVCITDEPAGPPVVTADAYGGVIDASGTELDLQAGTLRVGESLSTGTLRLSGGTVGGDGAVTTAGFVATGGTVATAVSVSGPATATAAGLTIGSAGRLELAVDATLTAVTVAGGGELVPSGTDTTVAGTDLDLGGTVAGEGSLVVAGSSVVSGRLEGSVRVVVPAGGVASVDGYLYVHDDAVVRVVGTLVKQDAQWVYLADRSRVEVPGTLRLVGGGQVERLWTAESEYGTGVVSVEQGGLLEHEGLGSGAVQTRLEVRGTARATGGELRLGGGPETVLHDGSSLVGVDLSGTATVPLGATATVSGSVVSGTVSGAGTLSVTGSSTVSGRLEGSVRALVPVGGVASVDRYLYVHDDAVVRVAGTLVKQDAQWVYLADRSRVEVPGVLRLVGGGQVARLWTAESEYGTGVVSVEPAGVLEHTGVGTGTVSTSFVNTGTVTASEGSLQVAASCPCEVSTGAFESTGSGTVSLGATTTSDPLPLGTGATLTTVELDGAVGVSGRVVGSGTVLGGDLRGAGTFVAQGTSTAAGGTLSGSGTFVVPAGSSLDVPAGTTLNLAGGRGVVVSGTTTVGGDVQLSDETSIDVRGTATLLAGARIQGGGLVLVNGTLVGDAGLDTAYVSGIDNEGTVRARSGTLELGELRNGGDGAAVLTGGRWVVGAGATLGLPDLRVLAAEVVIEDATGVIRGTEFLERVASNGVLRLQGGSDLTQAWMPLVNNGLVDLGPGSVLTVEQGYTQLAGGTLRSGVTADGLGSVAGPATLDGRLVVARDPAFVPPVGVVGTIVDSTASLAGTRFAVTSGLDAFDDRHLALSYLDDAVDLVVESGPAAPAPAPVSDLETTMAGQSMTLSWSQPAEVDRTIVVRKRSAVGAASIDDGTVVCRGTAETCSPSFRRGTTYSFTVFPVDDGVVGRPASVVRHGSRVHLSDTAGTRIAGRVIDVRTGARWSPPRATTWTRRHVGAAWRRTGRVAVVDGRFRVRVPTEARWIRVTTPGMGRHLPARIVVRR